MARVNLGFPAGRKKTCLINLENVFLPGTPRRLRLRTNLEVYWDSIEWAQGRPDARLKVTRLDPSSADLHYRGYSVVHQANASSPELPDYQRLAATTQIWRDLEGYYTRYGDVRGLLAGIDDRYVIMNAGDEIALRFPRAAPAAGGMGARLRHRRRWLDQRRRLQFHLLTHRAAFAVPRENPLQRVRPASWKTRKYIAGTRKTGKPTTPAMSPPSPFNASCKVEPHNESRPARTNPPGHPVCCRMLATPLAIRRVAVHREAVQAGLDESQALARYGFHLQEVSQQAGVHFIHQAPELDPKLDGIMPQVASMGASVSVVDFDRDGWPDLYVTNSRTGSSNALYRNMHDGTFQMLPRPMGVGDVNRPGTGVSMGAVWGDYDNDGYEDLFLFKWGKPELFHNDRGHGFTRVSESAGPATLDQRQHRRLV